MPNQTQMDNTKFMLHQHPAFSCENMFGYFGRVSRVCLGPVSNIAQMIMQSNYCNEGTCSVDVLAHEDRK